MLRQDINDALKTAMKAKDVRATSTLRLILAALKDRDIAARSGGGGIGDDALLEMLQKMIKQRHDSIEQYRKGNRPDLVRQEEEEIEIIKTFLPRQMSDDEVASAIDATVTDIGAGSIKDMGRTMSALKERYAGKMDFAKAAQVVKQRLAAN
ncbi:MAG: GatB/YqeY domain-containing protein [Alphaproteobacteria bacterium]|nr:GatB/YqeY domain-containing protein [Alphaproteobacteria bacterium]